MSNIRVAMRSDAVSGCCRAQDAPAPAAAILPDDTYSLQSHEFLFYIRNTCLIEKSRQMYRCHFLRAGRIVQGLNLKVETLDAAIATGRKILADHIELIDCDRLEIWLDSALLYKFVL